MGASCSEVHRACADLAAPKAKATNERGAVPAGVARRSMPSDSESDAESQVSRRPDFANLLGRRVRHFEVSEPDLSPQAQLTEDLMRATRAGDYDAMLDVLAKGAAVNSTTQRRQSPLMLAAAARTPGANECMQLLLDAAAELEAKDVLGWSALLYACRNNRMGQVDMLLKARAQLQIADHSGRTAVMLATLEGGNHLVQILAEQRAQLTKKDQRGWTPLFHAASEGNVDLVKWLLRKHCSAQDVDKDRHTALMVAYNAPNNTKVAHHLLKRACSVNAQNDAGDSVLMMALRNDQTLEFARWLQNDPFLDVLLKNAGKEDAIDICEQRGLHGLRLMLESKARLQAEEQADKEKAASSQMAAAMDGT